MNKTLGAGICMVVFDYIVNVRTSLRKSMSDAFICIGVIAVMVNLLVAYIILKTGQWQNQSSRLLLFASVADICNALISNSWFSIFVIMQEKITCQMEQIMHGVAHLPGYGSAYMFSLIALDRYLRISYSHRYLDVFNATRYKAAVFTILVLVVIQAVLSWAGPALYGHTNSSKFNSPLNFIILSATVVFYVLSIRKLLRHQQQMRQTTHRESESMTKIAATYLTIFFIMYLPIVVYQLSTSLTKKYFSRGTFSVISFALFYIPNINGILNACAFFIKNRKARTFFRSVYKVVHDRVMPSETSSHENGTPQENRVIPNKRSSHKNGTPNRNRVMPSVYSPRTVKSNRIDTP